MAHRYVRSEARSAWNASGPPENRQEALLRHVLGLRRGAEHPAGEAEDRRPVPLVEQQERGLVPSARPEEQLGFRGAFLHSPPPGGVHSTCSPDVRAGIRPEREEIGPFRAIWGFRKALTRVSMAFLMPP